MFMNFSSQHESSNLMVRVYAKVMFIFLWFPVQCKQLARPAVPVARGYLLSGYLVVSQCVTKYTNHPQ